MSAFELAVRLEEGGFLEMALPLFLGATREAPADPEVWVRAGRAALKLERPELAAQLLEECLRLHPSHRRALSKLMIARLRRAEFAAAADLCRRVLALDPRNVPALITLGHLSPVLGAPEEASGWYRAALAIEEKQGTRHILSFYARLLLGDYAGAWGSIHPDASFPEHWFQRAEPAWRGEEARERTVCVHSLGGIGDVLMWVRYLPLIAERVGRVLITAPPSLDRVLASAQGLGGIVRDGAEAGDALHIVDLQLPSLFGAALESVPVCFPYLHAPATGPQLPRRSRFRAGLVWAGNPTLWTDPDRSVPDAALLAPLLQLPGIEWVSLQVGAREEWGGELGIALRPPLADFGDTAFVLQQLDLVVTVDTAVANLALAMGIPTWVLPPTYPEFRWGAYGEPSPWYPAARLFRRRHTGEWAGVIGRVADALRQELCAPGAGVASPRANR